MEAEDKGRWRALVKLLRWECPCALPVQVRRVTMPADCYGDTEFRGGERPHFRVRIGRDLCYSIAKATLIHEWAHCLSDRTEAWQAERRVAADHSSRWGIEFAFVYRVVEEEEDRNG